MAEAKIYLDLPSDLHRVLDDNGLTVEEVLRREGLDLPLEIRAEELPAAAEGEREKDIGLVLMGASGLALSLGAAASMVILALSKFFRDREHAPKVVEKYVVKEITGASGQPQKVLVPDTRFIQPDEAPSATEIDTTLNLTEGVVVKFRTEDNPTK
jgi:hypothetical protein